MDIQQIQFFASLSNTLSFRETARQLSVSQSSVSRRIGELERELGVSLFLRTNRRVSLTQEGTAFLPYALDILSSVKGAEDLMSHYKEGTSGHLSIASLASSSGVLSTALAKFSSIYPNITVDVALLTALGAQNALTEQKYDLHFIQRDMIPADGRMDWLMTHRDTMSLVVPKGHPLSNQPLDFSKLKGERFILTQEPGNPVLYSQIRSICTAHSYTPNSVFRYDTVESVLLAISAGLGISIMPSALPKLIFSNQVDVIPIDDMDTSRTYVAAWAFSDKNPALPLFLEVLQQTVEES